MPAPSSFPLVRGRTMRVTKVDTCCAPEVGATNSVVSEGFVSVALSVQTEDAEEITVVNANGRTCVRDAGSSAFQGYGVEITFCEVEACTYSLITGQPVVTNATAEIIGFKMNSDVAPDASNFALEVWMGVPGAACSGANPAYGYVVLPCVTGGVVGDFTIENAAITFTITGAQTKDGNQWSDGAYADAILDNPLDPNDHLVVLWTESPPPAATDGCVAYALPTGT